MNAFNTVNLAGACILTSTEHAQKLGIPKDKWVHVLGGAGTSDSNQCKYQQKPESAVSTHLRLTITSAHSLGTTKLLLQSCPHAIY